MGLLRSPVQARVRSTSPLVPLRDDDEENLLLDVAQPAETGSSSSHRPEIGDGAASSKLSATEQHQILQRRLDQSLALVAASPSSKHNAPTPFAPSSKLRRSPPRHSVALEPAGDRDKHDGHSRSGSPSDGERGQSSDAAGTEGPPKSSAAATPLRSRAGQRNFDVAARALFDERRVVARHQSAGKSHLATAGFARINSHVSPMLLTCACYLGIFRALGKLVRLYLFSDHYNRGARRCATRHTTTTEDIRSEGIAPSSRIATRCESPQVRSHGALDVRPFRPISAVYSRAEAHSKSIRTRSTVYSSLIPRQDRQAQREDRPSRGSSGS